MSYSRMQNYINELFEENQKLKSKLKPRTITNAELKDLAFAQMSHDNQFLKEILDHAIMLSKQAINDAEHYRNEADSIHLYYRHE